MTASKLQRLFYWVAWAVAAILLGRFAIDFVGAMPAWLGAPFVLLVAVALGVAALNIPARGREEKAERAEVKPGGAASVLLLLSIPLGFLASSLDCTGLSLAGCTPFCTFIKTVWVPLLAAASAAYLILRWPGLLPLMLAASAVPLVPHCLCFNPGNGWWIERLGASPTCYAWGFVVSLIAIGALRSGRRVWLALLVNGAIIGGATAFFVGHHYFHFPW
ncbi:MAG TPA: hypothetical protein VKA60_22425 [Blastocatellia bacterium]|nr:hypothetical protein [Blastocatellia bacterium]